MLLLPRRESPVTIPFVDLCHLASACSQYQCHISATTIMIRTIRKTIPALEEVRTSNSYGRDFPELYILTFCSIGMGHQRRPFAVERYLRYFSISSNFSKILLALRSRDRLGISQELDASLYSAGVYLVRVSMLAYLLAGQEMNRPDRAQAVNPFWNHYQCSDGGWIALAMLPPDKYWGTFCKAIGAPHLEKAPKFVDWKMRQENREELIAILDKIFATKTRDEWLEIMRKAGDLGCEPINTVAEAADDPQTVENGLIIDFEHPVLGKIKMQGPVVQLMGTPGRLVSAAPEVGQNTEEVLLDIGNYTWEEIEAFRDQGAI